jgi:FkbM family methyltransferase
MATLKTFDVRIANSIRRRLNNYIVKRTYVEPPPTEDEIWQSKFTDANAFTHILSEELQIKLYNDSLLCRLIYFGFEKNEILFLQRFLKKGDTFLDIGANIGLFSLYASKVIGDLGLTYAFEPTPNTFQRLLENISINNCKNIIPVNIGLSNKNMVVDFNVSEDGHDAWNSIVKLDQLQNWSSIKVNVETLDSFIKKYSIRKVDLIKLDVEGWEKFVLEGGEQLLRQSDTTVLLIEFTEDNAFKAGYYCGELFDYVESLGYLWYSYNSIENTLIKEVKKLHYPYENLIAIKNYDHCYSRIALSSGY